MAAFKRRQPEGFLYPGAAKFKSCQGMKPKAPTGYAINCVMLLCLRVSAPGPCGTTQVGEGRGRGYSWEAEGKRDRLLALRWLPWNMERSLVPGGAASTCFPPGCLCCNVAWTWGCGSGWLGGHTKLSLLRPCAPLLGSIPRSSSSPLFGEVLELMIWCLFNKGILMLVCRQQGVLDLIIFPLLVCAKLTFVWKAYPLWP